MTHKKAPPITTTLDNVYFIMCDLIWLISEPTSGTGYNTYTYTRNPLNKMAALSMLQIQEVVVLESTNENYQTITL